MRWAMGLFDFVRIVLLCIRIRNRSVERVLCALCDLLIGCDVMQVELQYLHVQIISNGSSLDWVGLCSHNARHYVTIHKAEKRYLHESQEFPIIHDIEAIESASKNKFEQGFTLAAYQFKIRASHPLSLSELTKIPVKSLWRQFVRLTNV